MECFHNAVYQGFTSAYIRHAAHLVGRNDEALAVVPQQIGSMRARGALNARAPAATLKFCSGVE